MQVEIGSSCVAQVAWNLQFCFSRLRGVTSPTAQRVHWSFCLHSHSVPLIPSCTVCVLLPRERIEPYTEDTVFKDPPTSWPSALLQSWCARPANLTPVKWATLKVPSRIGSWHLSSKCSVWFSLIYNSDFFFCQNVPVYLSDKLIQF